MSKRKKTGRGPRCPRDDAALSPTSRDPDEPWTCPTCGGQFRVR
ncbi:hypothetical protein [Asanoa hainanensis]|nr:hypothetical protein [Asanoa hainanensis]